MKLSLVFELLLIFVLLAFAASEAKSVGKQKNKTKAVQSRNDAPQPSNEEQLVESSINKYCRCNEALCNCCKDFSLPYVNLEGPGCASLKYMENGKMAVSLSFGKKVITNKTLKSNKPSPVCMPLPGGITKFCGRVYNIARSGEEFRACLGLELQNRKTVEAAVRVSCFKFGPRGVHSEPADPLPLVPQDEKADEEDDEDDDDDDDYGLGDDDDSDLTGINDVDSSDYTGFSLLSEDLLGDLFGESPSDDKKPNKNSNKNRKKQAPLVTTTTTTKRPRTTRPRTTRRPISTTARTTTVRIRPATRRTRRPSRKPGRPNRRPTTSAINPSSAENNISSLFSTTASTTATPPSSNPSTVSLPATERIQFLSTANDETYQPILLVTQRPFVTVSASTQKPTTNFADPGIEMSLAQLTGQLSAMPAAPIVQEGAKNTGMLTTSQDLVNFEKVETITPKLTTAVFASSSNEDMVQIVQSLDSEEQTTEKEKMAAEETRSHQFLAAHYEGLSLPKKKNRQFSVDDLDVLDLTSIGESVGEHIGLFGRDKRQHDINKEQDNKEQISNNKVRESEEPEEDDDDDDSSDYDVLGLEAIGDTVGEQLGIFGRKKRQHKEQESNHGHRGEDYDMLEAIGESLALDRADQQNVNTKKGRSRQNKMMRGDWSLPQV